MRAAWPRAAPPAPIVMAAVDLAPENAAMAECLRETAGRIMQTAPAARLACVTVIKTSRLRTRTAQDESGAQPACAASRRNAAMGQRARPGASAGDRACAGGGRPGGGADRFRPRKHVDQMVIGAGSPRRRSIGPTGAHRRPGALHGHAGAPAAQADRPEPGEEAGHRTGARDWEFSRPGLMRPPMALHADVRMHRGGTEARMNRLDRRAAMGGPAEIEYLDGDFKVGSRAPMSSAPRRARRFPSKICATGTSIDRSPMPGRRRSLRLRQLGET